MNKRIIKEWCRDLFVAFVAGTLVGLFFYFNAKPAKADEVSWITDDDAVYCIMGEARGEGYDGMIACAEALRNRGSVKGVYGCQAKFKEPQWVWERARKAWRESAHTNTVLGAQYWGSLVVDQHWIKRMEKAGYTHTLTVKNTAFYREG